MVLLRKSRQAKPVRNVSPHTKRKEAPRWGMGERERSRGWFRPAGAQIIG